MYERKINLYRYTRFDGKSITLDIETGAMTGWSGRPVKKLTDAPDMFEFLMDKSYQSSPYFGDAVEVFNRLISLFPNREIYLRGSMGEEFRFFIENWKGLAQFLKNEYKPTILDLWDVRKAYKRKLAMADIEPYGFSSAINEDLLDGGYLPLPPVKLMAWSMRHEAKAYKDDLEKAKTIQAITETMSSTMCNYFKAEDRIDEIYAAHLRDNIRKVEQIRRLAAFVECPVPENGDLDAIRANLQKKERLLKEAKGDELFAAKQSNPALVFETDRFKTVIPMTRKECIKIGNEFDNCFGNIEWCEYFSTGRRYGVVIYDKVKEQNVVCTDIDIVDGKIVQYLSHHNRRVTDPEEREFKELYQQHLTDSWRKE